MKKIIFLGIIAYSFISCQKSEKKSHEPKPHKQVEYIYKDGKIQIPVTVTSPPKRAALFSPSATEILLGLGLGDRIVIGMTEGGVLPQYKSIYEKVPNKFVGHSFKMEKEAFLLTQPDFVSGNSSEMREDAIGIPEKLIEKNIYPFVLSSMNVPNATLENVFDDIKTIGKIFSVEQNADNLINDMKNKLANANLKNVQGDKQKPKAMVMASIVNGIWIYGSLATDLINKANGKNIYDDVEGQYELVSYESILERNPDIIFMADIVSRGVSIEEKIKILKSDPILRDVSAVKNNRIYRIDNEDIVPSLRNVDFIIRMNKIFYQNGK